MGLSAPATLLMVSPRKLIDPSVTGARPRIARPIVVLPEPDSPTRLRVSPGARSKETPSMTVVDLPRRPGKRTTRSRIDSSFSVVVATGLVDAVMSDLHQFDAAGRR